MKTKIAVIVRLVLLVMLPVALTSAVVLSAPAPAHAEEMKGG